MTTEEYDILHANIAHCYTKLHHSQTINAQSQCNVAYMDSCVIVMHQLQLIFFHKNDSHSIYKLPYCFCDYISKQDRVL